MDKYVECVLAIKYPFEEAKETADYIDGFLEDVEEMSEVDLLRSAQGKVVDDAGVTTDLRDQEPSITRTEWEEQYKPIRNPNSTTSGFWGNTFASWGSDLDYLNGISHHNMWTLVERNHYGTAPRIRSGIHSHNGARYFVTEVPCESDLWVTDIPHDSGQEIGRQGREGLAKSVECVLVIEYPFHEDMPMEDIKGGFVEDVAEMSAVDLWGFAQARVVDDTGAITNLWDEEPSISRKEWEEQYKLVRNPNSTTSGFWGNMFASWGSDLAYLKALDDRNIWTLVDTWRSSEVPRIRSGFHDYNMARYFVTEVPCEGNLWVTDIPRDSEREK